MKIGIDARLWGETGVGRYIRNLVKNLYAIDDHNSYVLFCRSSDSKHVRVALPDARWSIVSADIHWHSFAEQYSFLRILYKEKVDLMHFPYFSLPVFYTRPFVTTVHDLIIHHFPTGKASTLPLPLYSMKRVAYKTVLRRAVNRSKKIIVPLQATKKDVIVTLHVPEDKIAVTYEGFDEGLITRDMEGEAILHTPQPYFLYVGNAYPHKNLETLLSAFRQFKKSIRDTSFELLLVGKNDYFYYHLERFLAENQIHDVRVLHGITDEVLAGLYKHATAVVAPSFMEGFGLVPLEAMASGCVVIASAIPAHQEVCHDAAIYFDPKYTQDLVFAMENVYNLGVAEKAQLLRNGKNRISEFSWERMARETLAIYESSLRL